MTEVLQRNYYSPLRVDWRVFRLNTISAHSPSWQAVSHSASQKIPHFLWMLNVHYRVQNSPPLLPVLSQMNPVHTLPYYFAKIHAIIIIPSTPSSSELSVPFRFSDQNLLYISYLSHACYMLLPSHPPWFDHLNNILWGLQWQNYIYFEFCYLIINQDLKVRTSAFSTSVGSSTHWIGGWVSSRAVLDAVV